MFSSRVSGVLNLNRLSSAVTAHRAAGHAVVDLTVTNPTTVGISYGDGILAPLADPRGCRYQPQPFGLITARTAVASDYARRGTSVAEDRIVLTSSTSEAYSLLFKLLCAPSGDEVLVPAPSYPLFDHLTQLDGVSSRQYPLEYHGRWEVDVESVDRAWMERTRAVLAVSPNNPTGSMLSAGEFGELASRCAERDAALIVDEVFADYSFATSNGDRRLEPNHDCLSFHLGGLSKSAGLPQVKLGWIRVDGPQQLVAAALDRLELICDTYLSVSTPVQVAAPALIESGAGIRRQIRARIQTNYAALQSAVAANPAVELLAAEGGWSAVIRVPSRWSEEELVIALLRERDVLVHPGFFFDFAHEAFLVLSLLPDPPVFADGVARVMEHVGG
ncbi:MAG: pyridoxal phosphate-dependent aminotransferase [Acidobacteriota bacterium]|nr:pyridoxal phosphate-dependent aminotransferase [Acidobacteriota bacterium]